MASFPHFGWLPRPHLPFPPFLKNVSVGGIHSKHKKAAAYAQDSTMKEVPILLVANKVDLRNSSDGQANLSSFVSKKEGENLAEVKICFNSQCDSKNGICNPKVVGHGLHRGERTGRHECGDGTSAASRVT